MAVIKDDIIFCKEKQINELNIVILSVPPFYCMEEVNFIKVASLH